MKQSSFIFGAIIIAFLIYIIVRGQLPDYIALFTGKPAQSVSEPSSVKESSKSSPYTDTLQKVINDVFSQAGLV